ncbi:hypothetical protein RRG08_012847 [Elysia crispata]|uniref:Uncharacterized protein n=1 Tax=Elysia crispata TaxID=231223 RepID=A0AAE1B7T1_9GAST|nr:hypothetical protein RRG08_012847 [Elysia crispata]
MLQGLVKDLKSAVVRYRSDLMRTGRGELPKIPEYFETVMGMIGDQKALLNGIEGNEKTQDFALDVSKTSDLV